MKNLLILVIPVMLYSSLRPSTFTVTSNVDGTTTDGVSLRWAITQANSSPGVDTITFNIPGTPPHVIAINTLLPNVGSQNVYINGLSQPANSYTGPEPRIVIQDNAGLAQGLYFFATSNSKVDGIWIRDFDSYGIYAFGSSINVTVEMCKLSNNLVNGVYLVGSSANLILRNSTVWANGTDGVDIFGAGAYCTIENNLISFNGGSGVVINGGSAPSVIKGNKIGTDSSGTQPRANNLHGLIVNTNSNIIGGFLPGEGNTIAYNFGDGIRVNIGDFNLITHNSLFCNAGLGINLTTGGNNNFAAPVITSATTAGAAGTAPANSRVEVYYDTSCVGCEGKNYIASVFADASGNWTYTGSLVSGTLITATAADTANDNTSRFSACVQVILLGEGEPEETGLWVYPNPCAGQFWIEGVPAKARVEVFNMLGEYINSASMFGSDGRMLIRLADHAPGVYAIKVKAEFHERVIKIILE